VLPERHRCLDRRKFRFKINRARGARAVEVYAYVNGKLVLHKRGRDIRQITLKRLPKGKFKVRIEVFQSTGSQTISVRWYRGCKKSAPRTWRGPGRDPQ
jgi:hypothetical protein